MLYYTYDDAGKLLSMNFNGTEYFYQRNALGDVIGIYNTSGYLVVSYEYDAYGNIVTKTDSSGVNLSVINPYRYRGYRFDEETGWCYLNSRYLNPETGRFLCSDGYIGQQGQLLSTNMYTYALNNPNTYFDPSGYIPVLLEISIGIAIDVLVDLAFAAVTGPGVVALQFLTNILSEVISTVFINLLNAVDWALNLDKNILSAVVFGGAMIVGGIVVAKLMKKFKVSEAIGSVFKKIFNKTDDVLDKADNVPAAIAKRSDALSSTATPYEVGLKGEKYAGCTNPKSSIEINGRTRIPDGLDINKKILIESKNVASLSKTSQLTDFMDYSSQNGYGMELWVRQNTKLSGPLKQAIEQYGVMLKHFPW